ncbi:hypothetical protein AVEN_5695-1 [Araneus ventricosus]|uniref:Uncharacterized protein n=1 Tax=Araneus ventricosus TaxID=182803 RepID=A0A4Y2DVZ4_ARAVE|nr:hypothetical protein AVEN_5695-1 [Araneus ventricosus]
MRPKVDIFSANGLNVHSFNSINDVPMNTGLRHGMTGEQELEEEGYGFYHPVVVLTSIIQRAVEEEGYGFYHLVVVLTTTIQRAVEEEGYGFYHGMTG